MLVTAGLGSDPVRAAPIAAAIELLHNFTLVHDDIQDRSHLRRHRPTVWSLWGEAQAINAGDALFAASHLALSAITDHPDTAALFPRLSREFDRTTLAIVGGQTMDIENEGDPSVTPVRYIETITGKTSAIVAFSAWAGGLAADANELQLDHLTEFGRATGLAFQIRDDLLGIWGTELETGKTPADDLRRRKQTLPVLELRRLASEADRTRLEAFDTSSPASPAEVAFVLGLLEQYGVRELVEREIGNYHDIATRALDAVVPRGSNAAAEKLFALLDNLEHRTG